MVPDCPFRRFYLILSIPIHLAVAAAAKSLHSCLTRSDPMDGSLPGSSIHGIFQARTLELGAIAFSGSTWLPIHNFIWPYLYFLLGYFVEKTFSFPSLYFVHCT